MRALHLTGQVFGRLVVLRQAEKINGRTRWVCQCECGTELTVSGRSLTSGNTRSCACLQRETLSNRRRTHGMRHTREYTTWAGMIARCTNARDKYYADYGGRGITVCPQWRQSFATFFRDMGERPCGLSIERMDNNGNYEPGNCKWATAAEQGRNKRPRADIMPKGVNRLFINAMNACIRETRDFTCR